VFKHVLCFILESTDHPEPSWHSSFPAPVEVDSEVTIAETSADTPLVAGATAFNFPLVFTATSAIKLTFTAFNAVGM
jgi:hypothetical protein